MSKPVILIIDDEQQIRKMLSITLQSNGFEVAEASTAKEGIVLAAGKPPDLILLDLGLPDENGHKVLKNLREWFTRPVLILSVQNNEDDIVSALDEGANDYLVKPFRTGELLARIRSAIRKTSAGDNPSTMEFGNISIDFAGRAVKKENMLVRLTATEYSLFVLLAKNEGKVLTHHFLLNQVWGPSYINESQYLRVFVAQLRKKIEPDPNRPRHIITEPGVGYRFMCT